MSLKLVCHSNWSVTQIGMSLKFECLSNLNVTKIGMSLKLKYHSNWKVTRIGMSHKLKCHSNWKTILIEKVVSPKTSKSASIGRILSLLLLYGKSKFWRKKPDTKTQFAHDFVLAMIVSETVLERHLHRPFKESGPKSCKYNLKIRANYAQMYFKIHHFYL